MALCSVLLYILLKKINCTWLLQSTLGLIFGLISQSCNMAANSSPVYLKKIKMKQCFRNCTNRYAIFHNTNCNALFLELSNSHSLCDYFPHSCITCTGYMYRMIYLPFFCQMYRTSRLILVKIMSESRSIVNRSWTVAGKSRGLSHYVYTL